MRSEKVLLNEIRFWASLFNPLSISLIPWWRLLSQNIHSFDENYSEDEKE